MGSPDGGRVDNPRRRGQAQPSIFIVGEARSRLSTQVTRVDTSQSPSNERTCLECGLAATEQAPTGHWFCTVCHTAFRRADLNQLLIEVEAFASRYVVFANEAQAIACVLFAAYTHAADQFDVAPYVAVTAPEKQSGKTRLLEVLGPLCARALRTSNISPAAPYRTVAARAADIWEPLLAVAERAGGDWPERAERAALALTAATQIGEEDSAGLQLLSDIRSIWSPEMLSSLSAHRTG